jgi:NTE family protein
MKSWRGPSGLWRWLALLIAALATQPANSAGERIGLVLGGGGARGAAHIGVLKVLEREHIPIHAIAGTSIGAVIGGLYAAGYSPEEIETAINSIDWVDIFHDGSSRADLPMRQKETDLGNVANLEVGIVDGKLTIPTTLVRGQKLGLFLRRLFLDKGNMASFDELPIPFRCVATDIGTVLPVVFASGDLERAIRASMAVPGAFAPVRHEGKLLVDGGIVNNIPIDVARQMGVDKLIVVDVGQPLAPDEKLDTGFDVMLQMVNGLMRQLTAEKLKALGPDDVLLRPELGEITSASFLQVMRGIAPGEVAAQAEIERLRKFSVSEVEYLAWQSGQRQRDQQLPNVDFVRVKEDSSLTAKFVRDRISAKGGRPLNVDALEHDIKGAFGRGTYDSISYRLVDENGDTGLEIDPVDSVLGRTVFRAGFQISDDFDGQDDYQLNVEGRVTGLNSKGAEWRSVIGLGRVTAASTELYVPFAERGEWFVSPSVAYFALNQPLVIEEITFANYRVESWLGELRVGRDFSDRLRVSIAAQRGQDHAQRHVGDVRLPPSLLFDIGGLNATVLWDSLDSVRFPSRGMRAELSYTSFDTHMGSDQDGNLLRATIDKAVSFGRNTVLLGLRSSLSKDKVDAFQTQSSLGGLAFLSGLQERQLLDSQQLLARGIVYRRLRAERSLILDVPMYLGGSIEAGNVWESYDDVSLGDLIGAGSIFLGVDLPIGPLQLGYGRTFDGRDAFYLTFGSLVLPRYR